MTIDKNFASLGLDVLRAVKNQLEHDKRSLDVKMVSLGSFTYDGKNIDAGIKFLQDAKDKLNKVHEDRHADVRHRLRLQLQE